MSSAVNSRDFAAIIECNLSKNSYVSDSELSPLEIECQISGEYSNLIKKLAGNVSATYSEMLMSCFSIKALLSMFEENHQHNFQNAFFKLYSNSDKREQWMAIVAHLSEDSESGDILCTLYLRAIAAMYNECEISFLTDDPRDPGSEIVFDHENCKLAIILDTKAHTYEFLGGTFHYEENSLFSDSGNVEDLLNILGNLMDSDADRAFFTAPNISEKIKSSLKNYGGYHFKRCSITLDGLPTWHEFACLSLDQDTSKVLLTFKDIHELLSDKLLLSVVKEKDMNPHELKISALNAVATAVKAVSYPYACVSINEPFKILAANQEFYNFTGYTEEQFQLSFSNSFILIFHPTDLPYSRRHFKDVIKSNQETSEIEYRIVHPDGKPIWVHSNLTILEVPSEHIAFWTFEDVTNKKKIAESGISSHQVFNQTYSKSANILFDFDSRTSVLKDRGGLKDTLGFPSVIEDAEALIFSEGFIHPDDKAESERVMNNIRSGSDTVSGSLRIRIPNLQNDYAKIDFTLSIIFDNSGMADQIIGVIDKVTVQKEVIPSSPEETIKLVTSSNLFNIDLNHPRMVDTLTHYTINLTTDTVESSSGKDMSGRILQDYTGESFNGSVMKIADAVIADEYVDSFLKLYNTENLIRQFEQGNLDLVNVFHLSHPALVNMWIKVFTHISYDNTNNSIRSFIYACDVSEEYRKISSLVSSSSKDPLTGLHNRVRAKELISSYLDDMEDGEMAAFMIIDLDNFKEINDIYGHQTGDEYLMEFADALSNFLPDAYISRLGGDEFIIFLKKCPSISFVSDSALSILKIIKDANHSRITAFNTTGSIGIALAPSNGHDFESLYRNADLALYSVKNNQKDGYMFCDENDEHIIHHSNSKRKLITKSLFKGMKGPTLVLFSLIMLTVFTSFGIAANLYKVSSENVGAQIEQNYINHADYVYKHSSLLITDRINNLKDLAYYAGLHFNDASFKNEMDTYVQFYPFSEVEIITPSGDKEFYHYGSSNYASSSVMLDKALVYSEGKLPKRIRESYIARGTLVFSSAITSGDTVIGHIICTVDSASVASYLEMATIYEGENIYFAARDGIIISGSNTVPANLNKYTVSDFFKGMGFIFGPDTFGDSYHRDSVSEPSLSRHYAKYLLTTCSVKFSSAEPNQKITVISIIPEKSITKSMKNVLTMMLLLIVLCMFTMFAIMLFLFYSKNKKNSYVDSLAYKDSLTKLNNMNYLYDNNKALIKLCGEPCAIVSLNIDNFRIIKDAYGPAKSNKLITCIGNAIADFLDENETAARNFDDRYCMIMSFISEEALTDRLKDLRTHIFTNCNTYMAVPISFTLSMGVYISDSADQSIKQSYEFSELARTYFKDISNEGIYYYDTNLQQSIQRQKAIEDSIDSALENSEFVPFYQPIVDVYTRRIVAAEALTRWQKADGTMISPLEFIPLLEKHGTIVSLDYYIFEKVCAQMQVWKDTPLRDMCVSVNMSRQHFYQPDFIERLTRTTAKYGIPNDHIHIEITESIYVGDDQLINRIMLELREHGFQISMDDFGTGYSSMSMLQKMPIDILKIDKQFLDSSLSSDNGIIVLEGIVSIAKQLGLKTICEGVDSNKQINWLKTVGCDMIQGFYYSEPLPYTDFENFYVDYTGRI